MKKIIAAIICFCLMLSVCGCGQSTQKSNASEERARELIDSLGDADAVRIALGDWGSFHMGWVPMRQFGALNAANWSSGSGVFVYTPLAVYLAQ